MAQITGQDGRNLTSIIQQYLNQSGGAVQSEELVNLLNEYLQGGDRIFLQEVTLTMVSSKNLESSIQYQVR